MYLTRSPSSRGSTKTLEVLAVLDDARDGQRQARSLGHVDGHGGALVGVDPAEEEQIRAWCRTCLEGSHVDAVVDGGDVVEPLVAISLADGDVVAALVVLLIDGHDALGREAVDGRDDRRLHQSAVGERQEVEAVVDQVELAGTLEERRDMQALPDLGVQRSILGVSTWNAGAEIEQS